MKKTPPSKLKQFLNFIKFNTIDELNYRFFNFRMNVREKYLKFKGVNRDFYCQCEIENGMQCTVQCEHCKSYYAPLEEYHKKEKCPNCFSEADCTNVVIRDGVEYETDALFCKKCGALVGWVK